MHFHLWYLDDRYAFTVTNLLYSLKVLYFNIWFIISLDIINNDYTVCPTRYRTRHFFNNSNTNEDIATKFENVWEMERNVSVVCVCSALQISLQYPH
jgi:hypothetical protein